jgi:hypothetical protein
MIERSRRFSDSSHAMRSSVAASPTAHPLAHRPSNTCSMDTVPGSRDITETVGEVVDHPDVVEHAEPSARHELDVEAG